MFSRLVSVVFRTLLICVCVFAMSCTKSGGGDDGGSDSGSNNPSGERNFRTECGTLSGGELKNPIKEQDGELVTVSRVAAANALVIQRNGGEQLVKLVGLSDRVSDFQNSKALSVLAGLLGSAIFFPADDECEVTVTGGGVGIAGSLFTRSSGESFAEKLLKEGAASADRSARCGSQDLNTCYQAVAEENTIATGATISNFLWKPESERDGRLVVLFNPGGATVVVNGQTLTNTGASNGRGTTARGDRSGCGYGSNVQISATDSAGRTLVWPGQELSYTIPSGCDRVEF